MQILTGIKYRIHLNVTLLHDIKESEYVYGEISSHHDAFLIKCTVSVSLSYSCLATVLHFALLHSYR
jgi:hypothetical protein